MASTLIQTFDLNSTEHSAAVKLGAAAASYELDLEVHSDYIRLVGSFVVSASTALPANQSVVNIPEILGSDITFNNTRSVGITGYVPGAMPTDDPSAVIQGTLYSLPNDGTQKVFSTETGNTWPINTIVTLDVKYPIH